MGSGSGSGIGRGFGSGIPRGLDGPAALLDHLRDKDFTALLGKPA